MTTAERGALRRQIERYEFLFIIDEASNECGFAVHDQRDGSNLGTWIASVESLNYLVQRGAAAWLESAHNGMPGND